MIPELHWLQLAWFLLFGVLIAGYAVLDGFDLGVGILSLFGRSDRERRLHINAIAPIWDGNEVWLVTAGGALFAAFPPVYATVFSGFYLPFMLLLVALIARAVSMEFRGKVESPRWRRFWDWSFGLGSLVPALLYGVVVGNLLLGIPLSPAGDYTGSFLDLLHPFALLVGLQGLAMFICQGGLYMALKSEGDLKTRMQRFATMAWSGWIVLFVASSVASFFTAPARMEGMTSSPWLWLVLLLLISGLLAIPLFVRTRPGLAFLASSLAVAAQVALAGVSLFPALVPASNDPALSLTVSNASASEGSLMAMFIIAMVGMPLVLLYTFFIYRVFKGKVVIDEHSY
ncbi:MAG: cytochrome d ubiquinol oxidase subunit II [Deltaproteobacteria bacterium]|nr:cytochrome d ubiquinol oxidase subunit II [Deltaproteobacteria bacterium]